MTNEKCNGYTNWETWNAKNWLDQDYPSIVREVISEYGNKPYRLGEALEGILRANIPDKIGGVYFDYIMASLSMVDFREIAETYLEDATE